MWSHIQQWVTPITGVILVLLNVICAITIVFLEKRRANSSWAWIMVLFFIPYFGFIIYLLVGRSIYREKIFPLSPEIKTKFQEKVLNQYVPYIIHEDEILLNKYQSLIEQNYITDRSFLSKHNEIEIFTSGQEKFKSLFKDIEEAQESIYIQYYIFKRDKIGQTLCQLLKKKQRAGVQVYILYDDIGSRALSIDKLKDLTGVGVQVRRFFTSKMPLINLRMNNRNHRKIAVIDGHIAYTGGFNIGDEYLGRNPKIGHWRDTHLRIQGAGAFSLAYRFIDDWNAELLNEGDHHYLQPDVIPTPKYFPIHKTPLQLVASGPHSQIESIKIAFIKMIMSAEQSIYIQTPYFIPDDSIMDALRIAIYSGVTVHLMVPQKTDNILAQWANMAYIKELVQIGAQVSLYQTGFLHAKVLIIDDEIASVGSANFDTRSFSLNFEMNAFIYDEDIAQQLKIQFTHDLVNCLILDQSWINQRTTLDHITAGIAKLISPIL